MSTLLSNMPASPWHAGEKRLQERMGVAERMEYVGSKVVRDYIPDQHRDFYSQLPFVLLGSVDADGHAWASILEGPAGFIGAPTPHRLAFMRVPAEHDPAAANLVSGAAVGLLGIELHTRRRNRANGKVSARREGEFAVDIEQTFGNCPRYIQLRHVQHDAAQVVAGARPCEQLQGLDEHARQAIGMADTFFVASYVDQEGDPARRAVDVSHRGGQAGFVKVEGNRLTVPDFSGNLHFNTLGNLLANPRAGLLFIDFVNGDLLQLSGSTELVLDGQEINEFAGAERLWRVDVKHLIRRRGALALRWDQAGK